VSNQLSAFGTIAENSPGEPATARATARWNQSGAPMSWLVRRRYNTISIGSISKGSSSATTGKLDAQPFAIVSGIVATRLGSLTGSWGSVARWRMVSAD